MVRTLLRIWSMLNPAAAMVCLPQPRLRFLLVFGRLVLLPSVDFGIIVLEPRHRLWRRVFSAVGRYTSALAALRVPAAMPVP